MPNELSPFSEWCEECSSFELLDPREFMRRVLQGLCAILAGGGGGSGGGLSAETLCDIQEDGSVVPFLRIITSVDGSPVVTNTQLNGTTPYTITGTVEECNSVAETETESNFIEYASIDGSEQTLIVNEDPYSIIDINNTTDIDMCISIAGDLDIILPPYTFKTYDIGSNNKLAPGIDITMQPLLEVTPTCGYVSATIFR